jgi:hypothetical protein
MKKTFLAALLACAALPGAAQAADTVVATADRPTPIDVHDGRLLYSAWDPQANGYRLTELVDGVVRALNVDPSPRPFQVDMAWGPSGDPTAVYPRCTADPVLRPGRAACDLYLYDFANRRERALRTANSPGADETGAAVWRDRLIFTRTYDERRTYVYTRSVTGRERSRRLARGVRRDLDLRGTRTPFVHLNEWSTEPWLGRLSGGAERLVRVPGSGAAVTTPRAVGPTSQGNAVDWLLSVGGDGRDYSEIHRFNRHRDFRVPTRIPGAATGFAAEDGAVYYAVPAAPNAASGCRPDTDCRIEIHRADGLQYEPAPPIELE